MIVVTDLEGTLTAGETWRGLTDYLRHVGRGWAVRRLMMTYTPILLLSRLGLRRPAKDRLKFMEDLGALTRGWTESEWAEAARWVVVHALWPARHVRVMTELEQARQSGARVVICSGAFQPLVDAFAAQAGFEAIGTPLAWENGRATGAVAAPFTFGSMKAKRLRAYLGEVPIDVGYGDTDGDLAMLGLARQAVIIDHDPVLRREAETRGWRILTDSQAREAV